MKQQSFDNWFSANYEVLKSKVLPYNLFGELYNTTFEDVFHDSYLVCRENYLGDNPDLWEITFRACYKRQTISRYRAEQKDIRPKDFFWACLTSDDNDESESNDKKDSRWDRISSLSNEILKFARTTFSKSEYDLFSLYFKNGFSSYACADVFGVTQFAVYHRLMNMKHIVCAAFENEFENL